MVVAKKKVEEKRNPKLDYTITKTCAVCKKKYHPRKNGYELISRYCNNECSKMGRRMKITGF